MREGRLGAIARAVRRRQGLRQSDLAAAAGVDRSTISHLESGEADRLTIGTIRRCVEPLGMRVELRATWRGAGARSPARRGPCRARGRVDATSGPVGMGDVARSELQPLWRARPHRPRRLAPGRRHAVDHRVQDRPRRRPGNCSARSMRRRGWLASWLASSICRPRRAVVPVLLFRESMTNRRHLATLEPLFRRFGLRGRPAITWLRRPAAPCPSGLLIFSSVNQGSLRGRSGPPRSGSGAPREHEFRRPEAQRGRRVLLAWLSFTPEN